MYFNIFVKRLILVLKKSVLLMPINLVLWINLNCKFSCYSSFLPYIKYKFCEQKLCMVGALEFHDFMKTFGNKEYS